jgi:hypothetical protein
MIPWGLCIHPSFVTLNPPKYPASPIGVQDAIERGYQCDVAGDWEGALRYYTFASSVLSEALSLPVVSMGLSSAVDSVTQWRESMGVWQDRVADR